MRIEHHPLAVAQLKRHEGLSLVPYRCPAGFLTIGYGHNIDANPVPNLGPDDKISEIEAGKLLELDMRSCGIALDRSLPGWRGLCEPRQAVLLNMAVNLGVRGLLGFKKALAALRQGNFDAASREMLDSKWRRDVKDRALELAEQMRSGLWQYPERQKDGCRDFSQRSGAQGDVRSPADDRK